MGQKPINEEFEELEFEEQCKRVYETPIARKGDLIARSQDPVRLINSFSAEELYLTIREMDGVNIPEILQYANTGQLQFISDFECWSSEEISNKGCMQWLKYLEDAGEDKIHQWLVTADFELLIAGFNKYITVLKPYHEETVDDVIGDNPYFTLDGFYYIMIGEDNLETVKRAVAILFDRAKHLYYNLLEGLMSEVEAFVEEEAFQARTVRLTEKGFPAKEEASRIYRIITQEEWNTYAKREAGAVQEESSVEPLPLYPTVWREEKLFLDDVFAALVDVPLAKNRAIYQELIWLSNKILITEGVDSFGEAQVIKAFNHARHVLNCALETLSGGDIQKARLILVECWIEYIFRWGYSILYRLRKRTEEAVRNYWGYSLEQAFDFFDEPYGNVIRGLLRTKPQMYDPQETEDFYSLRDFRNVKDIHDVECQLDTFVNMCKLLATRPFIGWDAYIQEFETVSHMDAYDVRMSALVFTLFAQAVIHKSMRIKPLSEKEAQSFMKKTFIGHEDAADHKELKKDMTADFVADLFSRLNGFEREDYNSLKNFFDRCFHVGEEELGMIQKGIRPDFRFVRCLFLEPLNEFL